MRRAISETRIAALSTATRYTLTAQPLHWLTVVFILTTLPAICGGLGPPLPHRAAGEGARAQRGR
jgi:hypothetical protein